MHHPETCHTCEHGTDVKPEPGYDLVECRAAWARWIASDTGAADSLSIPQPFRCSFYNRASAESCGCDRGVRHKCEGHRA